MCVGCDRRIDWRSFIVKNPTHNFLRVLPYLLLTATLAFAFSKKLTIWVEQKQEQFAKLKSLRSLIITVLQLIVAVYGGFFGGGMGILFLASFALMGMTNIHRMNAYKTVLTSCINAITVIPFVMAGVILWQEGGDRGGWCSDWWLYQRSLCPKNCADFGAPICNCCRLSDDAVLFH